MTNGKLRRRYESIHPSSPVKRDGFVCVHHQPPFIGKTGQYPGKSVSKKSAESAN
jgi:hypothetical protein